MHCPNCSTAIEPISFRGRFGLTPREAEIADLVVAGNRNGSIAAQLGISEQTVKTHLNSARAKVRVSSRVGLVRVAFGLEGV